jgi:hypothetical protein
MSLFLSYFFASDNSFFSCLERFSTGVNVKSGEIKASQNSLTTKSSNKILSQILNLFFVFSEISTVTIAIFFIIKN